MNKVLKGLVAVAATAAMAVAGFAGASTAMADTATGSIKVAEGDSHTYTVYRFSPVLMALMVHSVTLSLVLISMPIMVRVIMELI